MERALSTPRSLVAGTLPFIERALNILGHSVPDPVDYPTALNRFYDRMFWSSTIGEVRRWIEDGRDPVFVKPARRRKRFQGLVLSGPQDQWRITTVSARLPVVCSNVVS
jgi:ATP-grasp domain, R2K clade family 2